MLLKVNAFYLLSNVIADMFSKGEVEMLAFIVIDCHESQQFKTRYHSQSCTYHLPSNGMLIINSTINVLIRDNGMQTTETFSSMLHHLLSATDP